MKKRCRDKVCKNLITRYSNSGLCGSCSSKRRFKNPKNCTNYIDGRSLLENFCLDCPKKISGYRAKRCRYCENKRKYKTGILNQNGNLNNQWIDGRSYEKYPLEFRKKRTEILERDNYTCQICDMTQKQHLKKYKRSLEVHHKDHNRNNNKNSNLQTLCKLCNLHDNKILIIS